MSVYATGDSSPGKSGGSPYARVSAGGKAKHHHRGFLGKVARYTGTEFVGHLGKDIGETAVGFGPGLYHAGRAIGTDSVNMLRHPGRAGDYNFASGKRGAFRKDLVAPTLAQYHNTYGHGFKHFAGQFYKHPLGPVLDALTVADLGASSGVRLGLLSGERASFVTRSAANIRHGEGPVHVELSSAKPLVRGRQRLVRRATGKEGFGYKKVKVGGEVKRYGKLVQRDAEQNALHRLAPYQPYLKARRRLSADEWAALHIRARDVHPDDLAEFWKDTPNGKVLTPKVKALALEPSKRMLRAEGEARKLSAEGEALYVDNGILRQETADARPSLFGRQVSGMLGREARVIHGDPYYVPDTLEPVKTTNPLGARGGGKAVPRKLGSTKLNTGALAFAGKLHLRSDVLGPEFLRRVKYLKYGEIHNALLGGAIRLTREEIERDYGGRLPAGYEYIRTWQRPTVPAAIRAEGDVKLTLGEARPAAGRNGLDEPTQFGQPETVAPPPAPTEPVLPKGALFHGSPEGELGQIDALYHTKMWREGQGFYATTSAEKAAKYAKGRTAKTARKTGEGAVNVVRLKPEAKVLNMDTAPVEFWRGIAEDVMGEKVPADRYAEWAKDIGPEDVKGASPGVLERQRLMHFLTGYAELPTTDAYYAIEDAIVAKGFHATLHHESGVPVYIIKDADVIERIKKPPARRPPPPPVSDQARLAALEKRHQEFQDLLEKELFNKKSKLNRAEHDEQKARNTKNGKIAQGATGKTKGGKVKGQRGQYAGSRPEPTVNEELRRQGQQFFEDYLAKHADEPVVKQFLAERAQMDELRAKLAPNPDTLFSTEKQIPNPDDLHDSQLAKDGFTTTNPEQALTAGEHYFIVPSATVKAAVGEFTRSSDFVHTFVQKPLRVWRSAVLGLRPGFFTNNFVGNSILYALATAGRGGLRDLFMSILETHGAAVAKKALESPATPPEVRADLYSEFFPDQMFGTFGRTQSPAASKLGAATNKAAGAWNATTGALPKLTSKIAEETPRRALIRHYIRHSPEFKKLHDTMPKQTRNFEAAARTLLEGKGGKAYQRLISKQVNNALGDYLHMTPFERNVVRNLLPFYAWYKAITTVTTHLAVDTPLRANILVQLGQIGKQDTDRQLGEIPSFLQGAIPFGGGQPGTQRVLGTQGANPYATLEQLRRGFAVNYEDAGANPFLVAALQSIANAPKKGISVPQIGATTLEQVARNLPLSRVIAPKKPSPLYPYRDRRSELEGFFGVPLKDYRPGVARGQAREGR